MFSSILLAMFSKNAIFDAFFIISKHLNQKEAEKEAKSLFLNKYYNYFEYTAVYGW